jgi:conjugative relaxase-like TrwC/TraI family protein
MVRGIALSTGGAAYVQYLELDAAEKAYWTGRGAEILDMLYAQAEKQQAEQLAKGIDPETGDVLRPRATHDLHDAEGNKIGRARTVYDFVVMAPQSVSKLAETDGRVIEAHREAVKHVQAKMQDYAAVHVRTNGCSETRFTGNLIQAAYEHRQSRPVDGVREPLLHTHLLTPNLTYDPGSESWKALRAGPIFRHRHELSEEYRYKLAEMLQGYGYEIEARLVSTERYPQEKEKLREVGFEVKGVEIGESLATQKRDQGIAEFRAFVGRSPTEKEIGAIVQWNRESKFSISPADGPWMSQSGGAENLSGLHLASAQRSYERWENKGEHSFGDYVKYTQEKWAKDPGMMERWLENRKGVENEMEKHGPKLDDSPAYERAAKRHRWDYGQGQRMGM